MATTITLPDGFDKAKDRCPMVILMHGFVSSRRMYPIPQLAKAIVRQGIGTICFDFNAHGESEGDFVDMTIENEIGDARAVFDYVCSLPYVTEIGLLGHSQGGVVAGMLAGQLEEESRRPACLVLLAPAAVLVDDAIAGQCMGVKYNAFDPPEYVNVLFHKLGRKFILSAQELPVYEVSSKYTGKVCIVHGKDDKIVPYSYSERYASRYPDCALHLIDGESHMMRKHRRAVVSCVTAFLKNVLVSFLTLGSCVFTLMVSCSL